ncbi:myb-interacting protein 40 isoform X2 [Lycorma delicatula]|uniref:myb-interacting protein 40 isoform X2 n=1 Tax=Lycorma delicatula TaxID=130591 RepID=UPI003F5124BF
MVKKRCVKTPTANRVKSEDKDARSPLSGDDVMVVARDRLKGALQDLIDQSDDDSESSQDECPPTPSPVIKSPIKKEPRQPARRRKKKVVEVDQAFHHTFVMKLFDRSVDLAQFSEDTPLYPICRAWMANQPRSTYNNTHNNSSLQNSSGESSQKIKEENGSPETSNNDIDEIKDVYVMPPPVGSVVSRIPSPEPRNLQGITPATFLSEIIFINIVSQKLHPNDSGLPRICINV